MSECTVLALKNVLEEGNGTLVDVREYGEFAGGRVSDAKLLPLGALEARHTELDHSKPIYVMCRTGRRSAEAQKKLRALGFTNVINVVGGVEAWKKEQLPLERDEIAPWAIERQVRFTAGTFVFVSVVAGILVNSYILAIAGLVGAGLMFSAATDTCLMGKVLIAMPWNRVEDGSASGAETAN